MFLFVSTLILLASIAYFFYLRSRAFDRDLKKVEALIPEFKAKHEAEKIRRGY